MSTDKPIFLLRGFMRSGTNWISNLLNLHPDICCEGEFHLEWLADGFESISGNQGGPIALFKFDEFRQPAREKFAQFVRELIEMGCSTKPEAKVLCDRTPAPLSSNILEDAKRIHVVRDGRDCLVSLTFHFLKMENPSHALKDSPEMNRKHARLQANQNYFRNHPESLLDDEDWVTKRARQWANRYIEDMKYLEENRDKVYQIHYETLHAETNKYRGEMYRFMGLRFKDANPLTDLTKPGFKKEDVKSHYRKGAIGDWKKYFPKATREWFHAAAGEALVAAGYEADDSWINE